MRTSALFYVTTTPGLEDVCRHELEGCQGVQCVQQVIPGGLTFTAPLALFLGVDQQPLQSICSLNAYIGTIEDISRTDVVDVVLER
jgi:23S rRNA G2445 N2-methylase RlmL